MHIQISKNDYEKIINHGKKEYPLECCGLLGGCFEKDIFIIKKIFTLTNIDKSSEHFSMDPKEQFAAIKEMRKLNIKLLGNYHSHPYTPSRPSEEDKRLAFDPEQIYGILSLEKEEPILKFFSINTEKKVSNIELIITNLED